MALSYYTTIALAPLLKEETEVTSVHQAHSASLPPVRKIVDRDDVELQKIDGKKNLSDPFIKALNVKEFEDYESKMGI